VSSIVNGRVNKVAMLSRIMKIKQGIHEHTWYSYWTEDQRDAAQMALNNVLDVLDEYWE